jgi:hypothetical protein
MKTNAITSVSKKQYQDISPIHCATKYLRDELTDFWPSVGQALEQAKLRFCYVVFNSHMFNATEVQLRNWCFHLQFFLFKRPIHVCRSRTPNGVRYANFPTTIIDQKVQLLKPFNLRELYAT